VVQDGEREKYMQNLWDNLKGRGQTRASANLTGFSFFSFFWDGVRLSPVRTSATNWPIVPAPDDR
jgi:hypothetical protein